MSLSSNGKRAEMQELALFSRQLSRLIEGGVPITRALMMIEHQCAPSALSSALRKAREDVENGATLAEALQRHPSVFPLHYVKIIEAGEASGSLDEVLDIIASADDKSSHVEEIAKEAIRKPKMVFAAIIVVSILVIYFVVPGFDRLFERQGMDLPLSTRVIITISRAFIDYWHIALMASVGMLILKRAFSRTEWGKAGLDAMGLWPLFFGRLRTKAVMSNTSRLFGVLLRSGLSELQSLSILSGVVENAAIREAIKRVESRVSEGMSLPDAMSLEKGIAPVVVEMAKEAMRHDALGEAFERIAQYYDEEVEATVRETTSALRPILLGLALLLAIFFIIALVIPALGALKILGA